MVLQKLKANRLIRLQNIILFSICQIRHYKIIQKFRNSFSSKLAQNRHFYCQMIKSSTDQFDSHCVCQICTCHKHKCPHSKVNIPFQQITSYQKQYIAHPLNPTQKFLTDNCKYEYKPYGYINSSYRQNYPGHKPQMRQKLVPRVKNQDKNIPFQGQSWYKSTYKLKSVNKEVRRNKDNQFNPCNQPFMGQTTYKSEFWPKRSQLQIKSPNNDVSYPDGYKFNANTTYTDDFTKNSSNGVKSYKPSQKFVPKGKHYLNSTYNDDFKQKKPAVLCPVLTLPIYPKELHYPNQHINYSKLSGTWQIK